MTSLVVVRMLPNMRFNVSISAYFLAEHGGCIQAVDDVPYETSFPG
jgi:hypothetical protein